MDAAYTVGHSVEVDGDEWIDLGPLPTRCNDEATAASPTFSQGVEHKANKNPFWPQVPPKLEMSGPSAPSEPMTEPEPEPGLNVLTKLEKRGQQEKIFKVAETINSSLPALAPARAPMSKAARSKEALMAFYLSRAKQMEAKHKKIVVSPTQPLFEGQSPDHIPAPKRARDTRRLDEEFTFTHEVYKLRRDLDERQACAWFLSP